MLHWIIPRIKLRLVAGLILFFLLIPRSGLNGSTAPHLALAQSSSTNLYLPLLYNAFISGVGDVTGTVIDAQNNAPLEGALICPLIPCPLDPAMFTFTDSSGNYYLSNIPTGWRTFSSSVYNYEAVKQGANIRTGQTTVLNFALSQSNLQEGSLRIILTWNNLPADLDAFLWTPNPNYPVVYYHQRGACDDVPYACLDTDHRDGYGPETTTITHPETGSYHYGVHNPDYWIYPGQILPLTQSGAQVRVYSSTGLVYEALAPTSGTGDLWYVFDLDGTSGQITPVNCITEYGSGDAPTCLP